MTESEKLRELENNLWKAADQLRANSSLAASQYSIPVLGLIFLRYADVRFTQLQRQLEGKSSGRRQVGKADYQAQGVMYVPENARFSYLRELSEGTDLGAALNRAMETIETENSDLKGVLPRDYARFDNTVLAELLRLIGSIPDDIEGDAFGKIYEYFLSKFAMSEGQRGGEFFTPTSIVKLIVDIIEPYRGRILDPACGSGGMFVQSARFVEEHQKNPTSEISIFGQERVEETIRLAKMNLAVHGLGGEIVPSNTYYEDPHNSLGRFDFVIANPPFNVNAIDKERIKDDKRYPYGIPTVDNGNYLWIQLFSSALNNTGRAGFVMANSASDARHSELAIRRQLIEDHQVDVMVAVGSNFFYTVTLPATLWFLDRAKKDTDRADKVLFIDARSIFTTIDRRRRDFTPEQHEFLANIVRLYRGQEPDFTQGSEITTRENFPALSYVDVPGLCKVATIDEIESHGWSLNPGRYVLPFGDGFVPLSQVATQVRRHIEPGDLVRKQGRWMVAASAMSSAPKALRLKDARATDAMTEWLNSRFGMDGPGAALPSPSLFVPEIVSDPAFQQAINQLEAMRTRLRDLVAKHDRNAFDVTGVNTTDVAEWAKKEASRSSQIEALLAAFHSPFAKAEALFPYPVAALVRATRVHGEPAAERDALLKLGEALVRTYGAIAVAAAQSISDVLTLLGNGPVSTGKWMEVIRSNLDRAGSRLPKGYDWSDGKQKIGWHLSELIRLRNEARHMPGVESAPEIRAAIAQARQHIEQVLEQSEWLAWSHWISVNRCEFTGLGPMIRGRALRGSDPQWIDFSIQTAEPTAPDSVVAVDERDATTLDLSPVVRVAACMTCMREEFYSLDKVGRDLTFVSMRGHSIKDQPTSVTDAPN